MSINLLPWRAEQRFNHIYHLVLYFVISAGVVCLVSITLQIFFDKRIKEIDMNINSLNAQIHDAPKNHLKQNKNLLKNFNHINLNKKRIANENKKMLSKLVVIDSNLPDSMVFQTLCIHHGNITLIGKGGNITDIHDYVTLLQKTLSPNTFTLSDMHAEPQNPSQFNFTIREVA